MTTINITKNNKQSQLLIEYLRTLTFVEVVESEKPMSKLTLKEENYLKNLKKVATEVKNSNFKNYKSWEEIKNDL